MNDQSIPSASPEVVVVGIGADGWESLPPMYRARVEAAEVVFGGRRHLALLPPIDGQRRVPWPSPLRDGLPALLADVRGTGVVALASGDPLVSGIATTLVDLLGPEAVSVLPAVSSAALARAAMRWSAEESEVVTLVGREVDALRRELTRDRRLVVLSSDGATPGLVARLLVDAGFGSSTVTVLANLGAADESRRSARADAWGDERAPDLNIVCVDCVGEGLPTTPGLPDDVYENDGQLSKRLVRAAAVCALGPRPGELLWDIGAGAGSVAVEWSRVHPRCRAIAVERDAARGARIARNAASLGVPSVRVVLGDAPGALRGLPTPDAVFVGGGGSDPAVVERCWDALRPGGRLVVHAVTLETEVELARRHRELGGELVRLAVETASSLGGFRGWSPARAVVQWSVTKPDTTGSGDER